MLIVVRSNDPNSVGGRVVRILASARSRSSEWFASLMMLALGLVMTFPAWRLDTESFDQIEEIAPLHTWAVALIVLSVVRMAALILNGGWRPSPHLRCFCAVLSCFLWGDMSLGLMNGILTAGFAFSVPALGFEIGHAYAAAGDARVHDRVARARRDANVRLKDAQEETASDAESGPDNDPA